ncbi:hypothetical protein INR49_007494 [Caranx melampygus]|nr:hypothetical protein INR49_007494 [Caranx melampygus]
MQQMFALLREGNNIYQLVLKHRQGRSSCSSLLFIYSFLNAASHPPSSSSAPPPPLALTNL